MRRGAVWLVRIGALAVSVLPAVPGPAQPASAGLYSQATEAAINRNFPSARVEYLLLDARTGETVAMRWARPERPMPAGSLLKPFVALAYGQTHAGNGANPFPTVRCRGKTDGCWRAAGHGSLALEQALAQSCNAYFLALARDLAASEEGLAAMRRVSAEYAIPAPLEAPSAAGPASARMWIGVTPEWRVSPLALAHAYVRLAAGSEGEVQHRLLAGMRMAALPGGTAARIGEHPGGVLAKTGTAACVAEPDHGRCIANGDGLVVALAPADHPRLILLVRERGTTGAETAGIAGQILTLLEEVHAR